MRVFISLLLFLSLSFSETVIVPIPGEREEQPGGNGGGGSSGIGTAIGVLIGAGLIFLVTKAILAKPSEPPRLAFIPFQFIVVYKGSLPEDVEVLESLSVEDLNFSLLKWEKEPEELKRRLEKEVLIFQPNYVYELMGEVQKLNEENEGDKGEGTVAVLDTGADPKILGDALLYVKNLRPEPYRPEPHGTAVAYLVHLPKKAKVALYRVCTERRCDSWSIIKALADVLRRGIKVVNMSFGTRAEDPAVKLLIKLLSARGTKITAPAGNSPSEELPFPARVPEVIAVAGSPCFPEKVCKLANVREKYIFELPIGKVKGTSFSSAFYAGKIAR